MMNLNNKRGVVDPMKLAGLLWPHVTFYKQQKEIIYSVAENDETFVPAGNMLGKDFVAGFIALWFFLTRVPCRVITTSVDHTQLEGVLWGEIRRFIQHSKYPLQAHRGGPLVVKHLNLRKSVNGQIDGLSYCIGRVAAKGEGMLGHHIPNTGDGIPRTLFIADEASGVDDTSYERSDTWANRKLVIGNPYPCNNFFKMGVKGQGLLPGGDLPRAGGAPGYYRKIIKIKGEDSPNVRFAHSEILKGIQPTNTLIVPGVLSYAEYAKRRATWDPVRQTVGLDADFYEGADALLFPPQWLNRAERIAYELGNQSGKLRKAKAIGVDTAEGGDSTVMTAVDELGVIAQRSKKTPDTSVITGEVLAFMREFDCLPENVLFDAGGGGKEHADRLRSQGFNVRAIAFGESATPPLRRGMTPLDTRIKQDETRYVYKNRRAEMYGLVRLLLEPIEGEPGWGIPAEYRELRRQLSPIPLMYDGEGRLELPPKNKRDPKSTKMTMTQLVGCSPDEADSLVLAVFGMQRKGLQKRMGVAF
jgi:hypothetical protein